MKTIKSLLSGLCLSGFLLGLTGQVAFAKTIQDAAAERLSANAYWVQGSSSDSKVMLLYYVGTSTESVVTITNAAITAYAPAGTADTSFGTASGEYDLSAAAYDTYGELCDAIDALANFGCELEGGKRGDNTTRLRNQTAASGTNDLKAAGGFEVLQDSGTAPGAMSAFDIRVWASPSTRGKRIILHKCEWYCNGADSLKVFGKSWKDERIKEGIHRDFRQATLDTDDEVYSEVIADDTAESQDFSATSGNNPWSFAENSDVVVSCGNGTSVQATANYLRCLFEER